MKDSSLVEYPEMAKIVEAVTEIDDKFRGIIRRWGWSVRSLSIDFFAGNGVRCVRQTTRGLEQQVQDVILAHEENLAPLRLVQLVAEPIARLLGDLPARDDEGMVDEHPLPDLGIEDLVAEHQQRERTAWTATKSRSVTNAGCATCFEITHSCEGFNRRAARPVPPSDTCDS